MGELRSRQMSHPPSDPRPASSRAGFAGFPEQERPVYGEVVGAVLLGLLLIVAGLYLWRRPPSAAARSPEEAASSAAIASAVVAPGGTPLGAAEIAPPSPVALSEVRVLGCHDRGPGKTAPDQCDHVASMEQALSRAVEHSAACVAEAGTSGSPATIEYVADFSFARQKVHVTLPRSGRSVHDRKVVGACAAAVREGLQGLALDGMDHRHARYRISVTATYRAKS